MQSQLFPPEIIENTSESYLKKISEKSQVIYTIVLLSIIIAILATPFIYIDVSVQSNGIIRTVGEKNEISSIVQGIISTVNVKDNVPVVRGQTLYTLKTDVLDTKIRLNDYQQKEKQDQILDLNYLVNIDSASLFKIKKFKSPLYSQQYNQFLYTLIENLQHQKKVKKELDADRLLFKEKVIAMREYDEKEFSYTRLVSEFRSALEKQITLWESDLNHYKIELTELQAQYNQLNEEKAMYLIKAPSSGTIQQLTGKYKGSSVQVGENLGTISPDSNLLVECYVSPNDIAFLKLNMNVNFQINSFNYNQWGLASGKITSIANDFFLLNQTPVFKVQCRLDKPYLKLRSGVIGNIKKGMSLRARFLITRRSIYQLFYDKIDDWINPKLE